MGCEPEAITPKPAKARKLNLPKGVPPLTSLYMYIAGSCNLACRHCWIEPDFQADNKNGKFLKLEYLKKAIKEAKPLGLQTVKLTGGEPMLHPQFREIVKHIESQKIGMIMETNGTLIDDEMAQFLKSKKFFKFISVSIDGAKPETHDKLRGVKGSFEKAVSGIKSLDKVGFHPQMICTLHQGNIDEIEDVITFAEQLGCGSIKFNHIQKIGRGQDLAAKQGLGIKKIIQIYNHLESEIIPKYKIQVYFDISMAFFSISKLLKSSLGMCSILNVVGLLSGGEIALCGIGTTQPELIFGHIMTDDLQRVWQKNPKLMKLREQIPDQLEGICALCLHRDICLGMCVANNFHETGKLNAAYYFCQQAGDLGLFPMSRQKIKKGDKYGKSKNSPL
jgi:SynChlorMet cassette radical SAM/SPASM protein ScmF